MPFVVLFIILAGAAAIFVLYPHLRAAAGLVCAVFGALLAYIIIDQTSETDRIGTRIAPDELTLADLTMTQGSRFLRVGGRVTNGSETHRLRDFDLQVTVRDCPAEDSDPATCAIIAQDTGTARVDVPSGQTRTFTAVIQLLSPDTATGVPVWDQEIVSVRATR